METQDQMHDRLLALTVASRLTVLPEDYGWLPMNEGAAPDPSAIACVRDGQVWSQLRPVPSSHEGPRMCVVSFHFPSHISGAGFIAWLATWIKREVNTGVVVIGGKDSNPSEGLDQGSFGVFDYWCCDAKNRDAFVGAINKLIDSGRHPPDLYSTGHWTPGLL